MKQSFAPYVSGLRIATRDPLVQLTWQDPPDNSSPIRVYRSNNEIGTSTFSDATLAGTVNPGVESFLDVPPKPGSYYYAVLVQKSGGGVYEVFVPYRNMTTRPIRIAQTATDEDLAASITGISASRTGNEVVLHFNASRQGRTLAVYRSISPIVSSDSLAQSTRVEEVDSDASTVTDYPVPGIGYYYAIVDTVLLTSGKMVLKAGENATATPVEVPLGREATDIPTASLPPRRSTPLPYLMLQQGIQSGSTLAPSLNLPASTVQLTPKTNQAVTNLLQGITVQQTPPLKPVVLNEDKAAAKKGPEYTLKSVVETQFVQHQWQETAKLLTNFLTLPLPPDIQARAQFYLGQAYYFQGMHKQAFLAFLLSRDKYYTETLPWLNAILDGSK